MLAAISTTILSRRSCALTGSAITSRSRRNKTRGPPSAPRMRDLSGVTIGPEPLPPAYQEMAPVEPWPPRRPAFKRPYSQWPAMAARLVGGPRPSPAVAGRDAAAGGPEQVGLGDGRIKAANAGIGG